MPSIIMYTDSPAQHGSMNNSLNSDEKMSTAFEDFQRGNFRSMCNVSPLTRAEYFSDNHKKGKRTDRKNAHIHLVYTTTLLLCHCMGMYQAN